MGDCRVAGVGTASEPKTLYTSVSGQRAVGQAWGALETHSDDGAETVVTQGEG